jgi:drug/metabolite transporter (DMT)-like permease
MELWHVLTALLSAVLHAGWNAVVKADARPTEMMTAQMVMAALLVVPGLLWTGLPDAASWPWIIASTSLNLVTVTSLLKAYEVVGFGVGYPVIRALSVLLVVPAAALLSGEMLSSSGLAGVALMALALGLLGFGNAGSAPFPAAAFGWVMLSGIATAAYVMCDARGVRLSGSPWAYGFAVSITNAVLMLGRQFAGGANPVALMTRHAAKALPTAVASVASYQLILLVWASAPVAPAAAIRDTSAVFAILIAVFWLKEPMTRYRLMAVACAAMAVPLLRFA